MAHALKVIASFVLALLIFSGAIWLLANFSMAVLFVLVIAAACLIVWLLAFGIYLLIFDRWS